MNSNRSTSGGIGFCSALFLLFLGLKLANCIAWSWWWIFAPVWIPLALIFLLAFTASFLEAREKSSCRNLHEPREPRCPADFNLRQ